MPLPAFAVPEAMDTLKAVGGAGLPQTTRGLVRIRANPLPALPEFRRFQEGLGEWVDGEPEAGPADVVGSYRLF